MHRDIHLDRLRAFRMHFWCRSNFGPITGYEPGSIRISIFPDCRWSKAMGSGFTPNVTLSGPITCLITRWICLRSMPQKWRRRLAAVDKLNLRYPVFPSSFWRANLNLLDGAPAIPCAPCTPSNAMAYHLRIGLHHRFFCLVVSAFVPACLLLRLAEY